MTMATMLEATGLCRSFDGVAALDSVALTIGPGDRHAIIGPNGAGKTTLLNLLAGTLKPSAGAIHWYGREITRRGPVHRARVGIGRSFQTPAVIPTLSTLDNLVLGAWPHPGGPRWPPARYRRLRAAARDRLRSIGLDERADAPAAILSHGQRRLLDITMALAGDPALLLLDEPGAGLDGVDLDRLLDLLSALPDRTAVVLVEHHLDLVASVAATVTVLEQGRVLLTGTHDRVITDPLVRAAYPGLAGGRAMLRVERLTAGYGPVIVLRDLSFSVAQGTVAVAAGPNGAGKTTLVHAIAGIRDARPANHRAQLSIRDGAIHHRGVPLHGRAAHRVARAGVAVVPQGRRVFGSLTVAEHLALAGRPGPWTASRVLDILPPLRPLLRRHGRHLSGGEQQMLAIARAMITNPALLLLDEPTEGLAPALARVVTNLITTLAGEGMTVLVTLADATESTSRLSIREYQ
jgi:ABC-type branched-subunit amino acid transport system ATPase component